MNGNQKISFLHFERATYNFIPCCSTITKLYIVRLTSCFRQTHACTVHNFAVSNSLSIHAYNMLLQKLIIAETRIGQLRHRKLRLKVV